VKLKDRDWLVRVNGVEFSGLDIEFNVKKSLRPEPNSCTLTVFGMHGDARAEIESLNIYDPKKVKGASKTATLGDLTQTKKSTSVSRAPKVGHIRVEIEAGYKEGRSLVFRGDLRRGISKYDGPEVRMEIEGEDGGRTILSSRINMSFPRGTRKFDVVQACAEAMGLGLGNFREVIPDLLTTYAHGVTVSGQASELLTGLLRAEKLSYSVQNGVLAFRRAGQGLQTRGLLINQDTGLVGRPERDATGALMVTTLMIPNVAPGQYIELDSKDFKGTYYIKAVETRGQSAGNDWYHICECYPG
jgi:hypothetical protein